MTEKIELKKVRSLLDPNPDHTAKVAELFSKMLTSQTVQEYKALWQEVNQYPDYDGMIAVGFIQSLHTKEIELHEKECRLKKGITQCPCPEKLEYEKTQAEKKKKKDEARILYQAEQKRKEEVHRQRLLQKMQKR